MLKHADIAFLAWPTQSTLLSHTESKWSKQLGVHAGQDFIIPPQLFTIVDQTPWSFIQCTFAAKEWFSIANREGREGG